MLIFSLVWLAFVPLAYLMSRDIEINHNKNVWTFGLRVQAMVWAVSIGPVFVFVYLLVLAYRLLNWLWHRPASW